LTEVRPALKVWLTRQCARPLPWLAAFAVLLAIQISPWWYPTPDAAAYLSIARGIALTHHLSNLGGAHLAYPPGYPLLISPAFLISSRPFVSVSVMHWLMAMIFMAGVYRWTRGVAPAAALLLTGLVMLNVAFWIYYRRTLSETAFMAVMIWTVIALNAALDARDTRSAVLRCSAGLVLLVALAMIRETGALLVAGYALAAWLEVRGCRMSRVRGLSMTAAVAAPAVVAVAAFVLYDLATARAAPSAVFGTHLAGFVDSPTPILPRVIEGLRLRISETGRLVVPGMFKAYAARGQWMHVDLLVYLAVFVLIVLGWWRLMRRRTDVLAASAPFYFALYAVWAFDADTRYLLPLLPLLFACLWFVIEPFTRWRLQALALLVVAHCAIAIGYWVTVEIPRARSCNQEWAPVAVLAAGMTGATGMVVAAPTVPECARLMLSFTIDHPVPRRTQADQFPGARTIMERAGDSDPPGFAVRRSAGPYKLLVSNAAGRTDQPAAR
jgi:hypothetical protein